MKREFCFLLLLIMVFTTCQAETMEEAARYTFTLQLEADAKAFPETQQKTAKALEALGQAITLEGVLSCSKLSESFSLDASLIPVDAPQDQLSFQLSGIPGGIFLKSAFLGDETIYFNNAALLEFAIKAYNHLGLPLQYPCLLFPYVHQEAFYLFTQTWNAFAAENMHKSTIPSASLQKLAENWQVLMEDNRSLTYWIAAVSIGTGKEEQLTQLLEAIPDLLIKLAKDAEGISVNQDAEGYRRWYVQDTELCSCFHDETKNSFHLLLPDLADKWKLEISYDAEAQENALNLSACFSITSDTEELLILTMKGENLPDSLSCAASFSGSFSILGSILPSLDLRFSGNLSQSGDFSIEMYEGNNMQKQIGLKGKLKKDAEDAQVAAFDLGAESFVGAFSLNDQTLKEWTSRIALPLAKGVLQFFPHLPTVTVQAGMDFLEEMGILDLLIGSN